MVQGDVAVKRQWHHGSGCCSFVTGELRVDIRLLFHTPGSSMINFYCKVGLVEAPGAVFKQMEERYIVNWNLMVARYFQDGKIDKAFDTCGRMMETNLKFDCVTLASIIVSVLRRYRIYIARCRK
ncbi:hypothetical protein PVAP13_4NG189911 [Panicum virgatum]|uniref:Pentatricopeptide repeat-containing protein n=1 Tax=Panicum virgatum TaxID=38727 RepID=A0A8T0T9T0_PANVG|nr:hypothetical protein PVAP13_4NG189911 [Panicum virgatum]